MRTSELLALTASEARENWQFSCKSLPVFRAVLRVQQLPGMLGMNLGSFGEDFGLCLHFFPHFLCCQPWLQAPVRQSTRHGGLSAVPGFPAVSVIQCSNGPSLPLPGHRGSPGTILRHQTRAWHLLLLRDSLQSTLWGTGSLWKWGLLQPRRTPRFTAQPAEFPSCGKHGGVPAPGEK